MGCRVFLSLRPGVDEGFFIHVLKGTLGVTYDEYESSNMECRASITDISSCSDIPICFSWREIHETRVCHWRGTDHSYGFYF